MNKSSLLRKRHRPELFSYALIAAGLSFCTLAYNLFLIPNDIAAGGFAGAAQLITSFTNLPVGIIMLCMNIPLFLVSAKTMGKRLVIKSLAATVLLSTLIDTVQMKAATDSCQISSLFWWYATAENSIMTPSSKEERK